MTQWWRKSIYDFFLNLYSIEFAWKNYHFCKESQKLFLQKNSWDVNLFSDEVLERDNLKWISRENSEQNSHVIKFDSLIKKEAFKFYSSIKGFIDDNVRLKRFLLRVSLIFNSINLVWFLLIKSGERAFFF